MPLPFWLPTTTVCAAVSWWPWNGTRSISPARRSALSESREAIRQPTTSPIASSGRSGGFSGRTLPDPMCLFRNAGAGHHRMVPQDVRPTWRACRDAVCDPPPSTSAQLWLPLRESGQGHEITTSLFGTPQHQSTVRYTAMIRPGFRDGRRNDLVEFLQPKVGELIDNIRVNVAIFCLTRAHISSIKIPMRLGGFGCSLL